MANSYADLVGKLLGSLVPQPVQGALSAIAGPAATAASVSMDPRLLIPQNTGLRPGNPIYEALGSFLPQHAGLGLLDMLENGAQAGAGLAFSHMLNDQTRPFSPATTNEDKLRALMSFGPAAVPWSAAQGVTDAVRRTQEAGPEHAFRGAQHDLENAHELLPGQKFLLTQMLNPMNAIGTGLIGDAAKTAPAWARGPLGKAAVADEAFQTAVGEGIGRLRSSLADAATNLPGGEWAMAQARPSKIAEGVRGINNVFAQTEAQAAHQGRDIGVSTGEFLGRQAPETPGKVLLAQDLLDQLGSERALQQFRNHGEQDVRLIDDARYGLGLSNKRGAALRREPGTVGDRNILETLTAAEDKAGTPGTPADTVDWLRQVQDYATNEGVSINKAEQIPGSNRWVSSPTGELKNQIDSVADVGNTYSILAAKGVVPNTDEARLATQLRFLFDRYGDVMPATARSTHFDEAVAQRIAHSGGRERMAPEDIQAIGSNLPEPLSPANAPSVGVPPEPQPNPMGAFAPRTPIAGPEQAAEAARIPTSGVNNPIPTPEMLAREETLRGTSIPPVLQDERDAAREAYLALSKDPNAATNDLVAAKQRWDAAKDAIEGHLAGANPSLTPDQQIWQDRLTFRDSLLNSLVGVTRDQVAGVQESLGKLVPRLTKDKQTLLDWADELGVPADSVEGIVRAAHDQLGLDAPALKELNGIANRWGGVDFLKHGDDAAYQAKLIRDYASTIPGGDSWVNTLTGTKGYQAFNALTGAWRQAALFTPRYHFMNVVDATLKSLIFMGDNGFVAGANPLDARINPIQIGQGIISRDPDLIKQGLTTGDLGKMIRDAWGRSDLTNGPTSSISERVWQAGHPGVALDSPVTGGGLATQLGENRGLERLPLGVGRLFRANHELGKAIESSARTAAFMHAYDDAIARGLTSNEAYQAGHDFAMKLHFDYQDTTNLDEALRQVTAFHIFATRNIPLYAEILATHPLMFHALRDYDEATDEQNKAAGLNKSKRYENAVPLGGFGRAVSSFLFGSNGELFLNPMRYVSISDTLMGGPPTESRNEAGVGKALDQASQFGISPAPWVQVPLGMLGTYGARGPTNLVPQAGLVKGAAQWATGDPTQIPVLGGLGQAYGLTDAIQRMRIGPLADQTQPSDPTIPIRIRLAEMSQERYPEYAAANPLNPIHPEFRAAMMAGPSAPLWQEAARDLGRQQFIESAASIGAPSIPIRNLRDSTAATAAAQAGLPEANMLRGKGVLDPIIPDPSKYQPGQTPVLPIDRQRAMQRRAIAGQPAVLASDQAIKSAPLSQDARKESAYESLRQNAVAEYMAAYAAGDTVKMNLLRSDPVAGRFIWDYLLTHGGPNRDKGSLGLLSRLSGR